MCNGDVTPLTLYGKGNTSVFFNIMYNLKNEDKDFLVLDDLLQIYKLDYMEYSEFQEAIFNTIRDTLNVIVACLVSMPAEERASMFRYCEEIISTL